MKLGLSIERVRLTSKFWLQYLDALGIEYVTTDIKQEDARDLANKYFENSQYHCLSRNVVLGQYAYLVEQGVDSLLVPSRAKSESLLICDSVRFAPNELSLKFGDKVKIYNPIVGDNADERFKVLYKLALQLGASEEVACLSAATWKEDYKRNNYYANNDGKNDKIMLVGRVDHFMDYANENSSLMKLLTDELGVGIVTPSMIDIKKRYLIRDNYRQLGGDRLTYWNRSYIVNSLYNAQDYIDGVLLIHDSQCLISTEEIQYLVHHIRKIGIPYYVLSIEHGALASAETSLEAFVDMIRIKKGSAIVG